MNKNTILKLVGTIANIVYAIVPFVILVIVMQGAESRIADSSLNRNLISGSLALLGVLFYYIGYALLGGEDGYGVSVFVRSIRFIAKLIGFAVFALFVFPPLISYHMIVETMLENFGHAMLALSGMFSVGSMIAMIYLMCCQYNRHYLVGGILAAPIGLLLGFGICFGLSYIGQMTYVVMILVALLPFPLAWFIRYKLSHRTVKESQGHEYVSSNSYSEDRPQGSEKGFRDEVEGKIRGFQNFGSWGTGLDCDGEGFSVDISFGFRRIIIRGTVNCHMGNGLPDAHFDYQSAAREKGREVASDLIDRVVSAVERYQGWNKGFDGEWSVSASGVRVNIVR